MVYYVDDETDKEWSVAVHLKPRDLLDMGDVNEEEIYENEPYQQQELEQFFDISYENIQIAIEEHIKQLLSSSLKHYNIETIARCGRDCKYAKGQTLPKLAKAAAQPTHSVQATSQLNPYVHAASQLTQSKKRPGHESLQHWTVDAIYILRAKRYQNLQKSIQPSSSSQGAAAQPTHSVQATSQLNPYVHAASQLTQSKKRPGHESLQHWTVDAIYILRAKRYQNLQKSIQPSSSSQGLVSFFQPTSRPTHSVQATAHQTASVQTTSLPTPSIHATSQPLPSFQAAAQPTHSVQATSQLNPYVHAASHTTQSKKRPGRESLQHWTVDAIALDSQIVAHIGGSKPNSRRRAEMMAESGQKPGRAQLYLATHKKEDGSYVNEAAREICEKIELIVSQSATDESKVSTNDVVGKVLGKEHSGRVRCLGLGATPSNVFRQTRRRFGGINTSNCDNGSCLSQCEEKYNQILNAHNQSQENYAQMMTAHYQMMNAFKAYMIMKEGTIPEQFAGIFVSLSSCSGK
uniref:Uncharacterized protein n=1 Tax=Nicotiana tabacum TaxID=4097 RepID=A0A1S4ALA2_TOBAC|nr:PREDICTED: uncharacterized protein LOC107798864 [Nicotiana tabacum]